MQSKAYIAIDLKSFTSPVVGSLRDLAIIT